MNLIDKRRLAWLLLLLLSIALHLWGLGERTFHHDEAIHGWFTSNLAYKGEYRYDPTYHGPFMYFFGSAVFWLLGDSDFTARLITAIFGIGLLRVAWSLRRPFGAYAAWWAGLLLTISPLMLYYGRFFRHDIIEFFVASSAFMCLYAALRKPGNLLLWSWFGVFTGLAFATKENAYVTLIILLATLLLIALIFGFGEYLRLVWRFFIERWREIAVAIAWFLIITITLYTSFFQFPEDWIFPVKAIRYWTEQHDLERVGGPWWYHFFRLLQYEFLILIAAFVWIFRRKKLRPVETGLFIFGMLSLAMYAYLGEKVAWLGIHQIWAFIPLAAAQLARTFGPKGSWWSKLLISVGVLLTIFTSLTANFLLHEITPDQHKVESLHYVQASPEVKNIAELILMTAPKGEKPAAMIKSVHAWPLVWYLRHASIHWDINGEMDEPTIIVLDPENEKQACLKLDCINMSYTRHRYPAKSWWLPENKRPTALEYLRYLLTRVPWIAVQSSDVVVLQRDTSTPD